MKVLKRVVIDPKICVGMPTIKGTRITISVILKMIANGATAEEALKAYPELKREDIKEALIYAAWLASEQVKLTA